MGSEDVQQLRVKEGFAAQDPKITVAMRLGVIDKAVHVLQGNLLAGTFHIYPAALSAELATRYHRDKQKRREILATLEALLVDLHGTNALDAEVDDELGQQPQ